MSRTRLQIWLLVVLSAVLQVLPFPLAGPVPQWRRLVCWICLVPLLHVLLSDGEGGKARGAWDSAKLGYLCGVLFYAGNCYWIQQTMHIYGRMPVVVSYLILLLFALYLGLYHALFAVVVAWLRRRFSVGLTLCAVPFVWTAVELARGRVTGFPWDLLGYSQVDNSSARFLAPLGGVMLISFIVAAVNTMLVFLPTQRQNRMAQVLWSLLIVLIAGGMSFVPFPQTYFSEETGRLPSATLLQENLAVGGDTQGQHRQGVVPDLQSFEEASRAARTEFGASRMASHPASGLIIWPEAPADFVTIDPQFQRSLSALARSENAAVIAGALGVERDAAADLGYREYGAAAVFANDGRYLGRYDKIHRVPWGEYVPYKQLFFFAGKLVDGVGNMDAGTERKVFELNGHKTGIFICYESIFGDEVRQFVKNGAEVLVNISDDGWYGDSGAPWQHLDMARMRAIENHRWILRDTNTGVTTAIAPDGRGDFTTPRHVRRAFVFRYGYDSTLTFYTRYGDWFAWLCVVVTLGMLGFAATGAFNTQRR